jgi:molybdopterin-containing oxidoreductase family iron-sulfur binding subunit
VGGPATAQTNGADVAAAVLALNALVGAVGAPGGVLPNPPPAGALPAARRAAGLADWQRLAARLREGGVPAVLVYRADPVHGVPASVGLADALARAPFIASFSSFPDDTTALADVVLPSPLPLEDWGALAPDPAPGAAVVTVQQPVVQPLHDTRGFGDTLLALATKLGGAVREALPWDTAQDALRETARALQRLDRGSVRAADAERFWVQLLQRGGWWDESFRGTAAPAAAAAAALREGAARAAPAQFAGAASDYPYYLVAFPHHTLGAGEGAHLPWLQATPDPTTSVVWKTWVEVNPKLGQRLGVREGDIVRLESLRGSIDLPVYIHPAAPPDVLSVPLGQGHAASGRWAAGRGANPLDVLAPLADGASGGLAYAATRVRLAKTGRRIRLPKLEGDVPAYQLPGQPIIKITRHER